MEKTPKNLELILKYFDDFTPRQLEQLTALDAFYKDWNSKINVISRKDIDSLYEKHVLHSLSIATITNFAPGMDIIDIGTGGGFPGIPLAIFFPEVKFHLVDSIRKKLTVVEQVAAGIGLTNVTVQHTRVEEIKNRKFNYAVSRAVAPLKDLWHWSKPLLRKPVFDKPSRLSSLDMPSQPVPPGLICLKGGDLGREIQESMTKPTIMEIHDIFPEPSFKDKYIVYIKM